MDDDRDDPLLERRLLSEERAIYDQLVRVTDRLIEVALEKTKDEDEAVFALVVSAVRIADTSPLARQELFDLLRKFVDSAPGLRREPPPN